MKISQKTVVSVNIILHFFWDFHENEYDLINFYKTTCSHMWAYHLSLKLVQKTLAGSENWNICYIIHAHHFLFIYLFILIALCVCIRVNIGSKQKLMESLIFIFGLPDGKVMASILGRLYIKVPIRCHMAMTQYHVGMLLRSCFLQCLWILCASIHFIWPIQLSWFFLMKGTRSGSLIYCWILVFFLIL